MVLCAGRELHGEPLPGDILSGVVVCVHASACVWGEVGGPEKKICTGANHGSVTPLMINLDLRTCTSPINYKL